jgi:hypothetical protein
MPTIGRRMLAGASAAESSSRSLWSCASPTMQTTTTTTTVSATTASCSQKPARVSTILRSSTAVRRPMLGRAPASRPVIGMSRAAALALIGRLLS